MRKFLHFSGLVVLTALGHVQQTESTSQIDNTKFTYCIFSGFIIEHLSGRVAQSVGHLTRKSGVPGSIPSLATYFRFSFRFFTKGSRQLLAKVYARSTDQPLRRSKPAQEKCGWVNCRHDLR